MTWRLTRQTRPQLPLRQCLTRLVSSSVHLHLHTSRRCGRVPSSFASDLDLRGYFHLCNLHRLSVGGQHARRKRLGMTGVHHDFTAIESIRTSNGSAEKDAHIPPTTVLIAPSKVTVVLAWTAKPSHTLLETDSPNLIIAV
jgi:hypothetical protein